jgi:hypothetical protein
MNINDAFFKRKVFGVCEQGNPKYKLISTGTA